MVRSTSAVTAAAAAAAVTAVFSLPLAAASTQPGLTEFLSTDYDTYNAGRLGHRPYHSFYSSPEHPPVLQVNQWNKTLLSTAGSHIFLRNDGQNDSALSSPHIIDASDLTTVYMNRSFENVFGTTVQEDRGKKYLTFWEGRRKDGVSDGYGLAYDENYRLVYNITTVGLPVHGDLHEFAFTGHGTALLLGVDHRQVDTSSWKGWRYAKDFWILDQVFQEVDLDTNELLFSWRLTDHIEPTSSHEKVYYDWDLYHMNSIQKTQEGNYLISIRHTWSIHLINGKTGDIIWSLGGKHNSFKELPPPDGYEPGAPLLKMRWQHHARWLPGTNETEMTLFDNHGKETAHGRCRMGQCSRALHIRIDDTVSPPTVQILREYLHPAQLEAQSQGSVQPLEVSPHGHFDRLFVGWGRCPTFTEHDAVTGETLLNVQISPWHSSQVPDALDNYRAFKHDWVGKPYWPPAIALVDAGRGKLDVHVSWNGATEVRQWVVKALVAQTQSTKAATATGKAPRTDNKSVQILARSPRTGFETALRVNKAGIRHLWAEPLDEDGKVLGTTQVVDFMSGNLTIVAYEGDDDDEPMFSSSSAAGAALLGGAVIGLVLVAVAVRLLWQRAREYDLLGKDEDDFDDECGSDLDIQSVLELDFVNEGEGASEPWQEFSRRLALR
ncbi:ASST-domain-containing protein [Coniella lustricola]|uniref:ASST-domain-containing protein n=1 Tax=Coniella lustricola TaxID=2025994 RepID=A0A2T3A2K7_9PEZI|nr:ASST-domain-containing protein [Coniella lustricola]